MHDLLGSKSADVQDGHTIRSARSAHFLGAKRGAYARSAHSTDLGGLSARKPSGVPLCDPPLYSGDQILIVIWSNGVKTPNEVRSPREAGHGDQRRLASLRSRPRRTMAHAMAYPEIQTSTNPVKHG